MLVYQFFVGVLFGMAQTSTSSAASHSLSTLATPFLWIDGPTADRNIRRLASYSREHHLSIRPHTKTHKSQRMGAAQLAAGAGGLTVAKVGEAEVMAEVCSDLLLAYPAVDAARCQRIADLAQRVDIKVAVDSVAAAEALASAARAAGTTVGLLVDLDVGPGRTGVQTPAKADQLASLIEQTSGVALRGLFCYPGHIWEPVEEQLAPLTQVAEQLQATLDLWQQRGLNAEIVSGGSTPTAYQSHLVPQFTEIRPGTYIYNDRNEIEAGYCQLDDAAARIEATVVSDAVPNQVVIDAGSKTLTSDLCVPRPDLGHGYVLQYPQARISKLSEEHGQVDVTGCDARPRIGERVTVIPNHICPCVNLQDAIWWRPDSSQDALEPLPVDARGRLS